LRSEGEMGWDGSGEKRVDDGWVGGTHVPGCGARVTLLSLGGLLCEEAAFGGVVGSFLVQKGFVWLWIGR
jgi:hypothetical protein